VAVAVALIAGLGAWSTREDERPTPALIALAAPSIVYQGETVTMYGGLVLPAGTFEVGAYSCRFAACRRSLWRIVTGPGETWGSLGAVRFDELGGGATIELRVFEADAVTESVLAAWRREVTVVAVEASDSGPVAAPSLHVQAR